MVAEKWCGAGAGHPQVTQCSRPVSVPYAIDDMTQVVVRSGGIRSPFDGPWRAKFHDGLGSPPSITRSQLGCVATQACNHNLY